MFKGVKDTPDSLGNPVFPSKANDRKKTSNITRIHKILWSSDCFKPDIGGCRLLCNPEKGISSLIEAFPAPTRKRRTRMPPGWLIPVPSKDDQAAIFAQFLTIEESSLRNFLSRQTRKTRLFTADALEMEVASVKLPPTFRGRQQAVAHLQALRIPSQAVSQRPFAPHHKHPIPSSLWPVSTTITSSFRQDTSFRRLAVV